MSSLRTFAVLFFFGAAHASAPSAGPGSMERLIQEVTYLRQSVGKDEASYRPLTLKLADLVFNQARTLSSEVVDDGTEGSTKAMRNMNALRNQALTLYREALSIQPKPSPEETIQIEFQQARILSDLGAQQEAHPLWNKLYEQTLLIDIRQEAALRLAEIFEAESTTPTSIKKADEYFRAALTLCESVKSPERCYYPRYRLGWMMYRQGQYENAIANLRSSLWDEQGRLREEVLRDLVMFYGHSPGNPEEAISFMRETVRKTNRPSLMADLSDSFFAAANKAGGIAALEIVCSQTEEIHPKIRLLEEHYGVRDEQKLKDLLASMDGKAHSGSAGIIPDSEKILKRIVVQLDGARMSQVDYVPAFQNATSLYLNLFPKSGDRIRMIDGWLHSEKSDERKLEKVQGWTQKAAQEVRSDEEFHLHRIQIGLAQKLNKHDVVAREASILAEASKDPVKREEYRYFQARAMHAAGDLTGSLPILKELAKNKKGAYGLKSQHLALDILNKQGQYDLLIAQAETWGEYSDMRKIAAEALFEKAAKLGNSDESLDIFKNFCLRNEFTPKSCENAKVIAVQRNAREPLYSLLAHLGQVDELIAEYEASGHFQKAAAMIRDNPEAEAKTGAFHRQIRTALLFELGGSDSERDAVLRGLKAAFAKKQIKLSPEEESLLITTLRDARLIDSATLKLPFSVENVARIAHELENSDRGNAETKRILLGSRKSLGPAWSRLVLAQLKSLDEAQAKISFIGKNSQSRFKQRLAALSRLDESGTAYFEGSDVQTRIEIATLLQRSHEGLAQEVLNSPLPPGLEPEAVQTIQAQLKTIAEPLLEKAEVFASVAKQHQTLVTTGTDQVLSSQSGPRRAHTETAEYREAVAVLAKTPSDPDALQTLKTMHESRGEKRLAYYYQGRLSEGSQQ